MYKHEVHEPEGGEREQQHTRFTLRREAGGCPPWPLEGLERKSAKSLLGLKLSELDIKQDSQEKKPVQKSGQGERAQGREGGNRRWGWGAACPNFFFLSFFLNLHF